MKQKSQGKSTLYKKTWFLVLLQIILQGVTLFFVVIQLMLGEQMYNTIHIMYFVFYWIIILVLYHLLANKIIRQRIYLNYENEINQEIIKKENEILKQAHITELKKIIDSLSRLFDSSIGHSFFDVSKEIERDKDEEDRPFCRRIKEIYTDFVDFKERMGTLNLIEIKDGLNKIIKKIEEAVKECGKQNKNSSLNYNISQINNLVNDFDGFIGILRAFYAKVGCSIPEFYSLRYILRQWLT